MSSVTRWLALLRSAGDFHHLLDRLVRLHLFGRLDGRAAILGVSLDDDPAKMVPPFARRFGLTFPLLAGDRRTLDA